MEGFTINLNDGELNALMMEEKNFKEVLKDHFKSVNKAGFDEKDVQDFTISEVNFDIIDLKGDFKLLYDVPYLSDDEKCDPITNKSKKTVQYSFILDIESKQVICSLGK